MTNVSKRKLQQVVLNAVTEHLFAYIAKSHTKRKAQVLVEELFTDAERLMFAKRLAIVIMLEQGVRFVDIQATLKVSPTTVTRVWKDKKRGGYRSVIAHCRHSDFSAVLDLLEKILQAGLPPRGRGRWRRYFAD